MALNACLKNLELARKLNLDYETRANLNNIAYIHMMNYRYEKANEYFSQIPLDMMREKHYYQYMISLAETKHYEDAIKIRNQGKRIVTSEFYEGIFTIYDEFLETHNLLWLNEKLTDVLFSDALFIDGYEIEFLGSLIMHHYIELQEHELLADFIVKYNELQKKQ